METPHVRSAMSSPVISVAPHIVLPRIKLLMAEHNIRRLPVVDKRQLVGIITLGDVRNAFPPDIMAMRELDGSYPIEQVTAGQVMRTEVITVDAEAPLADAARLMLQHKISGLPVLAHGQLVGMLTESDIFRAFIEGVASIATPPDS